MGNVLINVLSVKNQDFQHCPLFNSAQDFALILGWIKSNNFSFFKRMSDFPIYFSLYNPLQKKLFFK